MSWNRQPRYLPKYLSPSRPFSFPPYPASPPDPPVGLESLHLQAPARNGLHPPAVTPGYGWAGFMTYAPNIKQVAGGRQWYESTGSNSLCQAGKADSDEEARWQPWPRGFRAKIAGIIQELAEVLAGRANPRDGSPMGLSFLR